MRDHLADIYSDPKHVIHYTSNGEARQEYSIALTAKPLSGEPAPSDESTAVRWVHPAQIADLTMDRSMRVRLSDYVARKTSPILM